MKCLHKYVITNTPRLISPKGYCVSDRIFEQTAIAIHTGTIPNKKDLPQNIHLYLHEIDKLAVHPEDAVGKGAEIVYLGRDCARIIKLPSGYIINRENHEQL